MKTDLKSLCKQRGLTVTAVIGITVPVRTELKDKIQAIVTVRYEGRIMAIPYYYGNLKQYEGSTKAQKAKLEKIEPADVVRCLMVDFDVMNYSSFEEWAENSSYDVDSRKAEDIWKTCQKVSVAVQALLGADFEQFQESSQDY
jgi:hypothetical protein